RGQLQLRYATAQSLEHIRQRAEQIGLRTIDREQVRYLTIAPLPHTPGEQTAAEQAAEGQHER
ncbi:MAG: hypothetical protein HC828_16300, partial [Blastochloris sp.]|nr:hypothetical protein [Blastochloris sp.]